MTPAPEAPRPPPGAGDTDTHPMAESALAVTSDGAIRTLTFNRPARRNALDRATLRALEDACEAIDADPAARAVILTGAGDKAFVAGADITELRSLSPDEAARYAADGQRAMRRLETLRVPVVAAINGVALGGGLELALACTFRLMATTARVGLPEVKLGLIPGFGGTQRLARAIGRQRALDLVLTGRHVDADEAVALGIALRAVPPATLLDEARALAAELAAGASRAQALALRAVDEGLDTTLDEGCAREAALFAEAAASDDAREGLGAFLEKRQPSFTGR